MNFYGFMNTTDAWADRLDDGMALASDYAVLIIAMGTGALILIIITFFIMRAEDV